MSVTVTGANELYKNINRLAQWSVRDSAKLQAVGERVGDVYANYLKANVKDLDKDTSLRGRKIKKGQLRRSSGTWQPDKKRNTILAGPRTKAIGKRGKTTKYADGFYAHFVEKGDFASRFGGKHTTQNTGVFSRGIRSTKNRSEKLQIILLKRNFANYARGL
jgi:hypothetical protein|tara:strand:- start:43 stop:528 length:486 start_codon:yes stop_codon:yes gene_type:complete